MHIFAIYKPCKYQLATLASDGSSLAILKPCGVSVPHPMGNTHAAGSILTDAPTTPPNVAEPKADVAARPPFDGGRALRP